MGWSGRDSQLVAVVNGGESNEMRYAEKARSMDRSVNLQTPRQQVTLLCPRSVPFLGLSMIPLSSDAVTTVMPLSLLTRRPSGSRICTTG